jgi:ketosteroid isomerase-like protein
MEPTTGSAESLAHAFVRAINRQDVEAMMALMSHDHRFIDSLGNIVEGSDKMGAGWLAYFRMVPDYALAIEETYCDGPIVLMLGLAQGTFTRDGKLDPANRWQTPIAIRATAEDGKVTEWRVYADNEPMRRLMANGG